MADSEIYLFTGPEIGEKNDAIENIRKAALKRNGQLDEYKYYASDIRVIDVVSQLQNAGLFVSSLFIVLKNAESIKLKADLESLASWAKSSAAKEGNNTLILVSDENSVDKKLENLVPPNHKKIFWGLTQERKTQWLSNFFKKNGYSIQSDAVDLILEMIDNNTETLRTECTRFFYVFDKNHTINTQDVEKLLSHNREENAFSLFDAMCDISKSVKQRFESSLDILQKLRLSKAKESNASSLIAGLTWSFRQLGLWHSIHAKGKNPEFAVLKSLGFSSKTNQTRYSNAAKLWSNGTVASILALLSSTDMKIRETGTSLEDTYLQILIYAIVVKNGLFLQDYQSDLEHF